MFPESKSEIKNYLKLLKAVVFVQEGSLRGQEFAKLWGLVFKFEDWFSNRISY